MKQRIISAAIALAIFIPIIVYGGIIFKLAITILAIIGFREIINIRELKKKFPFFVKCLAFLLLIVFTLNNVTSNELVLNLDYKMIALLILLVSIPIIIYRDNDVYNISDSLFLIGSILLIGLGFNLFIIIRNYDIKYFLFLFLITASTDTYAYIGGRLSGRHKLAPSISPKKTIEGLIIGSLFGTLIACTYYYIKIDDSISLVILSLVTLLLSFVGQIGDLFFSSIKRYFNKKDFSNIMPGHGGILDRFDSIIFVLIAFLFFVTVI